VKNIIFYVGYEDELSLALIRKIFSQPENNYLIGAKFPGKGAGYLKKILNPSVNWQKDFHFFC
jgi:hypothetical protein